MSSVDEVIGPMQGRVMGVIIPPPEIRAVADKTAQFVAKNGKSFEQKILNSAEGKTPKFNFMRMTDPYYAYYEMKIREFEEGTAQPKPPATASVQPQSQPPPVAQQVPQAATDEKARVPTSTIASKASLQNPLSKFVMNKNAGEPPQFQFAIAHPPGLSAMDVDIIKLTAQYTALNGRDFLSGLAQREARNPQFDFLKPTHMLFSYFTTLVDSYAKLLQPTQDIVARAKRNADELAALEAAVQRWEWQRQEEEKRRRDAAEADAERNALAGVDWQDFTVVETIDFGEDELMDLVEFSSMNPFAPLPSSSASGASGAGAPPPPPPPPSGMQPMEITPEDIDADINVVSDYQPRLAPGGKKVATMIDPISGKAVPVADLSEHMRIQLMDPKWRIEQQRFLSKQAETSYAEGSSIADSLKQFARQRGDIFGNDMSEDEEAKKRQKKSDEPEPIMWDGHQASIAMVQQAKAEQAAKMPAPEPTYAPPAIGPSPMPPPPMPMMPPPAPPMTAPLPPPMMAPPPQPMMPYGMPAPMMTGMPMYPGMSAPLPPTLAPMMGMHAPMAPPMMGAGAGAAQSVAAPAPVSVALVSEQEFAARFPNPVSITVFLPPSDTGPGSSVHLSISVLSQIKDVKDMLVDPSGLAPNKQQIKFQGAFVKDAQTLASLNIGEGAQLELIGRSRGGKR